MKAERLFRVLGLIDPSLAEEAVTEPPVRRLRAWRRWAALAACLALVIGIGWLGTHLGMGGGSASSGSSGGDSASPGGAGGSGVEDGTVFMSYAGPVFPLAAVEDSAGLTAEREITWDFAPGAYRDGTPRQWGAEVTDAYVLRNATGEDITVTALYPFAGNLRDTVRPAVTVDGGAMEAVLYAGAYSGGFQSTFGAEIPDTMNLDSLGGWEEYRSLLEGGEYLAQALAEYPVLDMPVTVYEFSDFEAPHEQYPAATQAVTLEAGSNTNRVFTYGFNGMDYDDGALRQYSYFVPDGMRREPDLKLLVVLGEDIEGYTLQGYRDGGCDEGEEIEGVSCTVTRTETSFDAVLDRLCRYSLDRYSRDWEDFAGIPVDLYRGAAAELLTQYGALSAAPMDRYDIGFLDDILSETLTHDRVLYLAFPVTVPAGGSTEARCAFWKAPSFDFACSGSEHVGLQGYDLVTRLGSGLEFTAQRAALAHTEGVELAGQNFGFDPEAGITAVELDPEQEHYYMEVRVRET